MSRIHIVGAGLSGLAAALKLSGTGREVVVYESAGHAGGRCRSFVDDHLGVEIDNGNHLLLSGNRAAMDFLDMVGTRDSLIESAPAEFAFVDLADDSTWTLRPNAGRLPWWILSASRRIPGSTLSDYLAALRLRRVSDDATVADCFDRSRPIFRRFWEPLTIAVLNTQVDEAAAALLWPVMEETFGLGEAACRPCIARQGLSNSFAGPAVSHLRDCGSKVHFNARLRGLRRENGRVQGLNFSNQDVTIEKDDEVVLAVPAAVASSLLPTLTTPTDSRPIANAHFRLENSGAGLQGRPFLGILGGTAEWLFVRDQVVSVTVSAATDVIDMDKDALAQAIWQDVARVLGLQAGEIPPYRIVKERRATFAQTPAEVAKRPECGERPFERGPCRRLDEHRLARHHRGGDPERFQSGRKLWLYEGVSDNENAVKTPRFP